MPRMRVRVDTLGVFVVVFGVAAAVQVLAFGWVPPIEDEHVLVAAVAVLAASPLLMACGIALRATIDGLPKPCTEVMNPMLLSDYVMGSRIVIYMPIVPYLIVVLLQWVARPQAIYIITSLQISTAVVALLVYAAVRQAKRLCEDLLPPQKGRSAG